MRSYAGISTHGPYAGVNIYRSGRRTYHARPAGPTSPAAAAFGLKCGLYVGTFVPLVVLASAFLAPMAATRAVIGLQVFIHLAIAARRPHRARLAAETDARLAAWTRARGPARLAVALADLAAAEQTLTEANARLVAAKSSR